MLRTRLLLLAFLAVAGPALAGDWPCFRGPNHDGVSKETGLLKQWPKAGPALVWQTDKAGRGYAGMAVVGGVVYTMGSRENMEYVLALDAKGQPLWEAKIGPVHDWGANNWSHGPNGTPTVDGDLVFAVGSQGVLVCVSKKDGKPLWSKDLRKAMAGEVNPVGGGAEKLGWGYCWSPLVDGDKLIIAPGGPKGLLAALDKKDGKVLWQTKGVPDQATYGSPAAATLGGVRQYVYVVQTGVVGIDAKDGSLLWRYKREEPYNDVVCATPVVSDGLVYVSVGYSGSGAVCIKPTAAGKEFKAEVKYDVREIGNKQGGVVLVKGKLYGYNQDRAWMCQDLVTGKLPWPKKRQALKAGSVVAADGRLYVLSDEGEVAMLDASPAAFKLLSKFTLPKLSTLRKTGGHVWTHPSLSDGKLYLRDQELIYCYQVK
jgi:outer membrane protein assembly factor BamB